MSTFPEYTGPEGSAEYGTPSGTAVLAGHEVFDDRHEKIGTITDVLFDETGNARWAVVDPGLMHRERYVPIDNAAVTESGQVVIPCSKELVKHARAASRDHILSRETERQLEAHYALPSHGS